MHWCLAQAEEAARASPRQARPSPMRGHEVAATAPGGGYVSNPVVAL